MSNTDAAVEGVEVAPEISDQGKEQFVSQADVDRIVRERVARERAKYSDYDELKAKAAGSQTLEERLASLEGELTTAKATALRSDIAAQFGISTKKGPKGEPSDADLFLTGADVDTLTAQAERLAAREVDRKKQGNFAPKEGQAPSNSGESEDLRDFTKKLFNKE